MLTSISIAAPAFNEGESIGPLVRGWVEYFQARRMPGDYEIVVCDDGSWDKTGLILGQLAQEFPAVRPCRHAMNQGAAAALATAISRTTKDWVLLLDADGQYPIENLERFVAAAENAPGVKAFIGFRRSKEDSAFARFGSWASGWACNWVYGTRYRDFNCALKLVQGPLLRSLHLEARGLNYSTEISSKILERGERMVEIEAIHQPRAAGRSHRTLWRGSLHRFFFVLYLGLRQLLRRWKILRPAGDAT